MDITERARTMARLLVNLVRIGDLGEVSRIVRALAEPTGAQRVRLRQMLTELLSAATAMVLRQTAGIGPEAAIVVDLRRVDGSTVDIDELSPEVRAVVRAFLAEVNEHSEDTTVQLALALQGEPDGLVDGILLVLLWTVSAMTWCEQHDEPAPRWLSTTAA
ncbi:MAG TPA: hypothetical protein VGR06_41645 [Actinophytocola sp.]|jgi:hypothetical protein|uniref:hypothetical protein n=1 Tax=Actinophytocola sp. TaxID=1872138 RepID=UPI002DFC4A99|nr:hypothetical protein [Actinophytocola sp.]